VLHADIQAIGIVVVSLSFENGANEHGANHSTANHDTTAVRGICPTVLFLVPATQRKQLPKSQSCTYDSAVALWESRSAAI